MPNESSDAPEHVSRPVTDYAIDINLFVDHSQIVQLECLREGIWGTHGTWGRIASYKESGVA